MNEKDVDKEIEIRMREVAQARSTKSRNQVDKAVKKAFEEMDVEAVVFEAIHGNQQDRLKQMMDKDRSIVGALLKHKWYDEELRKDCEWNARVMEIRAKELVIGYWKEDEVEEDAEDCDVKIVNVMADVVLGDVVFD